MEEVHLRGALQGELDGQVVSRFEVDHKGAYPKVTRKLISLASTDEVTIGLANISRALVVGIEAETEFNLKFGAATTHIECRGVWVGTTRESSLKIAPAVATSQQIYIYAAGM